MVVEASDRSGWIGTILANKWHIDAKIARGGVATVFRATHRQGHVAAIKIMHPEFSRNVDVRRRFLREGYLSNKVGHPGTVRILDDDVTEDGSAFLVMELLEKGENLEDKREKAGGRLPVAEVVRICDQVLDVLAAAHENGIVHRDIKPDNIFVADDGTIKVLDFGIAHIKEAAVEHEPTATGLLLGTPEYMSPEQALGKRGLIDAQTDIWSLGATMFTCLSGEAVHVYDVLSALLVAAASRQARSLSSVKYKEIPREIIAVVDKALALEKARRWPNARAMQEALRKAKPLDVPPITEDKTTPRMGTAKVEDPSEAVTKPKEKAPAPVEKKEEPAKAPPEEKKSAPKGMLPDRRGERRASEVALPDKASVAPKPNLPRPPMQSGSAWPAPPPQRARAPIPLPTRSRASVTPPPPRASRPPPAPGSEPITARAGSTPGIENETRPRIQSEPKLPPPPEPLVAKVEPKPTPSEKPPVPDSLPPTVKPDGLTPEPPKAEPPKAAAKPEAAKPPPKPERPSKPPPAPTFRTPLRDPFAITQGDQGPSSSPTVVTSAPPLPARGVPMPLPKPKPDTVKPPAEKKEAEEKAPDSGKTAVIAVPAKEPLKESKEAPPPPPREETPEEVAAAFSDIPTQAGLGPPVQGNPWENEVDDVDGPTAALVGGPPIAPPIDPAAITQDLAPPAPPELSDDTSSMPREIAPNDMLAMQADTAQLEPLPPQAFQQAPQQQQWSYPPPMQQPLTPQGFPPQASHFPQPWQQQPMYEKPATSSSKTIVIIAIVVGAVLVLGLVLSAVFVLLRR